MRLVVTSDWHLDANTAGLDRFDDVAAAARSVVDYAIERAVRESVLFLFLGDLCDPDTQRSHRCTEFALEQAFRLKRAGVRSRWLVGNHDVVEDGHGTSTLGALAGAERGDGSPAIRVFSEPTVESFPGFDLVALPYVSRARAYDPSAFVEGLVGNALRPTKEGARCRGVVIGHLSVPGAGRGSESADMSRGREMVFPVDECRRRWGETCLLLNGHYHRQQKADRVWIPGSVERLRFDEEHHEPGFLTVEAPDA